MFGTDYIFVQDQTKEELADWLMGNGLGQKQCEEYFLSMLNMGGGLYLYVTRESLHNCVVAKKQDHAALRLMPALGANIRFSNFFEFTLDEEMAVLAHEFGHALSGHQPDSPESALRCELEADRYAAVGVGAKHMYTAIEKLVVGLELQNNDIMMKRLEALRPYI